MELKEEKTGCKKYLLPLLIIVLLGSFFRFYGLSNQSLWNDELSSWSASNYESLSEVFEKGIKNDVHPPGYQIMLYFVEKYIGDSECILRLPSVLSGILSIAAIFLLGKKLFSYKEGLISAALMAVLWMPIYYSQEARAYSLLLLFSIVSTYFWIAVLEGISGKVKFSYYSSTCYIISSVICCYLHYFGLYLIALQGLAAFLYFLRRPRKWLYIFLVYIPVLLSYVPWLPKMFKLLKGRTGWIKPPGAFFSCLTGYMESLFNLPRQLYVTENVKGVFVFAMVMFSFLLIRRIYELIRFRKYKEVIFSFETMLLLWLLLPFVGMYLKSKFSTPVLTYRTLIISLPAAYILVSRSITNIPIHFKFRTIVISAVLMTFLSLHLFFRLDYYSGIHKAQFREAVEFIVKNDARYRDSVIIGYSHGREKYLGYYFDKYGSSRGVDITAGKTQDIPSVVKLFRERNPRYIWYIRAHKMPEKGFLDFLARNLKFIGHKEFFRANVWLLEAK